MKDVTPTISIRASLDGSRPFLTIDARIPVYIEEDELLDVFNLMRRVRKEFEPDYRASALDHDQSWPWTPRIVAKLPVTMLMGLLGEDAREVTFPFQKVFRQGEEDQYDARGKTCGRVNDEQSGLAGWVVNTLLKRPEGDLDHVDKLGLAALLALGTPRPDDDEPEDF